MSDWPSAKSRRVLAALLRIGWAVKRQRGTSHRVLARTGWPDVVYAFHDNEEIGPRTGCVCPVHLSARSPASSRTPYTYTAFGKIPGVAARA